MMPRILQEFKLEISALLLVLGIFLVIVVVTGNLFPESSPDLLKRVHEDIGGWMIWLDILGPIVLIIAVYYFVSTLRMMREYERLMETKSKATFIRNQDRIEELAFTLTENHRRRLQEKKEELKIRL
jgi:hypothetical protein